MLAVLTLLSLQRIFVVNGKKYAWIIITIFYFTILLLAQARGGMLVFMVGLLSWILLNIRSMRWRLLLSFALGVSFSVGFVLIVYPDIFLKLLERGSAGRFHIWKNWYTTWNSSIYKSILGYGLSTSSKNMVGNYQAAHYHSLYLNLLFYGGIVGISLFFSWNLKVLKSVIKYNYTKTPWLPIVFGMYAGFLTDGDKLFSFPSALGICYVLPMLCLSFQREAHSIIVDTA
jgi:O-antigen ligase